MTITVYKYRKNGPKSNGDTDVILTVDNKEASKLAFLDLLPFGTPIQVTFKDEHPE